MLQRFKTTQLGAMSSSNARNNLKLELIFFSSSSSCLFSLNAFFAKGELSTRNDIKSLYYDFFESYVQNGRSKSFCSIFHIFFLKTVLTWHQRSNESEESWTSDFISNFTSSMSRFFYYIGRNQSHELRIFHHMKLPQIALAICSWVSEFLEARLSMWLPEAIHGIDISLNNNIYTHKKRKLQALSKT